MGLCIPLSLLGNNSVKTFPRQRRTIHFYFSCLGPKYAPHFEHALIFNIIILVLSYKSRGEKLHYYRLSSGNVQLSDEQNYVIHYIGNRTEKGNSL
jgi:hypothetical protein